MSYLIPIFYLLITFVTAFYLGRRFQLRCDIQLNETSTKLLQQAKEGFEDSKKECKEASKLYQTAKRYNQDAAKLYNQASQIYSKLTGKVPWDSVKGTLPDGMDSES